jgi:rhodanese-related sulfurtransferase
MMTTELPPVIAAPELRRASERNRRIRLLDVRTSGEFEGGHIEGSYNVPLDTLAEHAAELREVTDPVVLVCRGGNRARQAEQVLRDSGMKALHVLDGGMTAWQGAGYPVRQTGRQRWALDRQVRLVAGVIVLTGVILSVTVSPAFVLLAGFMGAGLTFSAVADWCGLAMLLARLPYNRGAASCDVGGMVSALKAG